ncbi:glyoxylate reductase [Tricharina praecox]|uniref:glyoxylate reductase n=1 Tax=Tricharina praecox TaxID=43433 RepID=UPI0022209B66|nr:glyoxylate reductase [Tricharina praecox]KAI5855706.1 glyoxylate reductase [Tricharina praecox]
MTKPKVLLLGNITHAKKEWEALSSIATLITPTSTDRTDFLAECSSGAFTEVIAAYRTFASVSITGLIDTELVAALPTSLKYLCHNGAGYDQVDVAACTAKGIRVSNVPTAVDDSTADVNLFLIIGAIRRFNRGMVGLRRGEWLKGCKLGHDPQEKVLGILGMGGIGRALKKRTDAMGMKTIYHNRNKLSEELEEGAEYVSFDELLSRSDVISLNLPLNKHTRHIISTAEFNKMKDGVVIINTARGAVMDEDALVKALDSGKVASCGLDVFEDEPNVHPGLVANENVMLVPHMGTFTYETQYKMECWTIENVRMAVEQDTLKSIVPEQASAKF